MSLELVEIIVRWLGGALAFTTLAILFYGIWRGMQRTTGRTAGVREAWLRSAWFYLASIVIFVGFSYLGWSRLPLVVSTPLRALMLALGSLFYVLGLFFVLWGRAALGKNYFVSTGFGAQLFEGHQLITSGPFAIVRHPMYAGLFVVAIGALLIYFTWTTLIFACLAPLLTMRARREEQALAAEFGEQ